MPLMLAMLMIGSLVIIPSLDYISTSINSSKRIEGKVKGLYAADAGVEDGLWRLAHDPPASFPYSYQINNINGLTVSVTMNRAESIGGEEVGGGGTHEDWLLIGRTVSYNAGEGLYYYTLALTNRCEANIKLTQILIDLPRDLTYAGPTGGDITTAGPTTINGDPAYGITLIWDFPPPLPTIQPGSNPGMGQFNTDYHTFRLSGPAGIEGAGGHVAVTANRTDVGTVFDYLPYDITAQARDAANNIIATVRAGVWIDTDLYVSCWQINP